jgi:hypothetical protein
MCVYIVDLKMTSWSLSQSVQVKAKLFSPSVNPVLNLGSRGLHMASVLLMKEQDKTSVNMIVGASLITTTRINVTAIPMRMTKTMTMMMMENA